MRVVPPEQPTSPIWVAMRGGLGNQLFQWAAAQALALDWDVPAPTIDLRHYRRTPWRRGFRAVRGLWRQLASGSDRAYFFRMFDRVPELGRLGIPVRPLPAGGPSAADTQQAWRDTSADHVAGRRVIRLAGDVERSRPEPVLLAGWLQAESLFAHRCAEIRGAIADTHTSLCVRRWEHRLAAADAVAVHVRRGDYTKPVNRQFAIQSPAYYAEAARVVRERTGAADFYVFTDDPAWARTQLDLPGRASIVSGEPGMTPIDDFTLMRKARHFVISNSTFSWWTAWLGERPGGCIVAPSTWIHGAPPPADILPSRWTVLTVPPLPPRHQLR